MKFCNSVNMTCRCQGFGKWMKHCWSVLSLCLLAEYWRLLSKHTAFHECVLTILAMPNTPRTLNKWQENAVHEFIGKPGHLSSHRERPPHGFSCVCPDLSLTIVLADSGDLRLPGNIPKCRQRLLRSRITAHTYTYTCGCVHTQNLTKDWLSLKVLLYLRASQQ